jgi:hypothetical protein
MSCLVTVSRAPEYMQGRDKPIHFVTAYFVKFTFGSVSMQLLRMVTSWPVNVSVVLGILLTAHGSFTYFVVCVTGMGVLKLLQGADSSQYR